MGDVDRWLAVLHVLGGAVWVGSWAAICGFAANVVRHPTADAVGRLFTVMRALGPTVIGPSTVLVLVAGIALVARSPRADMGDLWIVAGLVLYALVTLVGVLGLGRANKKAQRALDRDDVPAAVAATRSWLVQAGIVTFLLVIATIDMVVKP